MFGDLVEEGAQADVLTTGTERGESCLGPAARLAFGVAVGQPRQDTLCASGGVIILGAQAVCFAAGVDLQAPSLLLQPIVLQGALRLESSKHPRLALRVRAAQDHREERGCAAFRETPAASFSLIVHVPDEDDGLDGTSALRLVAGEEERRVREEGTEAAGLPPEVVSGELDAADLRLLVDAMHIEEGPSIAAHPRAQVVERAELEVLAHPVRPLFAEHAISEPRRGGEIGGGLAEDGDAHQAPALATHFSSGSSVQICPADRAPFALPASG